MVFLTRCAVNRGVVLITGCESASPNDPTHL